MEIQEYIPQIHDLVGWKIVGASVVGTSHKSVNRDCEDYRGFRTLENGSIIIAIADGAGSASHASEGAKYVVEKSLDIMANATDEYIQLEDEQQCQEWLKKVLKEIRSSLEKKVRSEVFQNTSSEQKSSQFIVISNSIKEDSEDVEAWQGVLRAYATTLLLVIITKRWLMAGQIGDGVVVVQNNDSSLEALTRPSHGEYINESNFITDTDYLQYAQYKIIPSSNVQGVSLLTDGLQMLALDFVSNTPHNPFFSPLFRLVTDESFTTEALSHFLESERVCERTDDDKTIVLAVRL